MFPDRGKSDADWFSFRIGDHVELLKVLAMPFQATSLLFVAVTSLLLGLIISAGWMTWLMALFLIWCLLLWLANYSLRLIDDAANGVRVTSAASGEMMIDPYLDARCWIHPAAGALLCLMHVLHPRWPVAPTLLAAALLFPLSLGACVMTGHARDAVSPATMLRVARGLGPWYPGLVAFVVLCGLAALGLTRLLPLGTLRVASLELLLLTTYAGIGGALYERRLPLQFEPRHDPERAVMRKEAERTARRQHFIDGLYRDLRVHQVQRALDSTRQWLASAQPTELAGDVAAILAAGRSWGMLRDYPRLLQGLLPVLLELKAAGVACTVAEAGLAASQAFGPASEPDAVAIIGYALDTGRPRTAARLLENHLQHAGGGEPGPRLLLLRERLRQPD